jgi:aminopeptidase N
VTRGLTEYLARFAPAGSASLDDLIGCWSRAARTDLTAWGQAWLRATGTPSLSATVLTGAGPAVAVTQHLPRPQRIGVALYDRRPSVLLGGTGPGGLRLRRTIPVELAGDETQLHGLAGEPEPAAVFANAGDWALAQVSLDPVSLAALAAVAFDVGDPLTEAALWNAAWHMVRTGHLGAVDYAALAARRLARASAAGGTGAAGVTDAGAADAGYPSPLTAGAISALLARAVACADRYVRREDRAAVRTAVADIALGAALTPGVSPARHRALLAGFTASAQTETHLAAARTLLDEASGGGETGEAGRPGRVDLALRGALVLALATRGRARPADLDGLTAADPVAGEPLRAACAAAEPEPAAKQAAWAVALDPRTPQRLARVSAENFWVPGQEELLAPYRDRYFTEALPALNAADARGERRAARLGRLLFPGLLDDPGPRAAARAALDAGGLTARIRTVLLDEEAELRVVAAVRAARPPSLAAGPV